MRNGGENWALQGLHRAFAAAHDPGRVGIDAHNVTAAPALPSVGALLLDAPVVLSFGLPVAAGPVPGPVSRLMPEVWVWSGAADMG